MNRSRMRRMLCHLVLEWDGLQLDVCDWYAFPQARVFDRFFRQKPLILNFVLTQRKNLSNKANLIVK